MPAAAVMPPEIRPMTRPSIKKGSVTSALVAPTYFMISISLRRAKTLSRMVLPTVMMLTAIRTRTTQRPIRVTARWIWTKVSVISMGAVTLYTPSILAIRSLMAFIWLRSASETR